MSAQAIFTVLVISSLVMIFLVSLMLWWRKPSWLLPLGLVFFGLGTSWMQLYGAQKPLAVFVLLALSFVAGYARPQYAWVWALLLGIWVPLAEFTALAIGLKLSYRPDILASCIALVPAFIGAYAGVLVEWLSARANRETSIFS